MPAEHDLRKPDISVNTTHATTANGVLKPDSSGFWKELRQDWETLGFGVTDLRTFLEYFHPENNRYCYGWLGRTGKYRPVWDQYIREIDKYEQAIPLDQFVSDGFAPPVQDPGFTEDVQIVRGLIELKSAKPRGWQREFVYKLREPSFWEEFSSDLTQLDGDYSFRKFLLYYNPKIPAELAERSSGPTGKYRALYTNFHNTQYLDGTGEILGLDEDLYQLTPPERSQVLYNLAPPGVRLQLSARFPKDFGEHAAEVLDEAKILPEEARYVLDSTVLLRADHREAILSSLATGPLHSPKLESSKTEALLRDDKF